MSVNRERLNQLHIEQCAQALMRNGFTVYTAQDQAQLFSLIHELIADHDVVRDGGSMTLMQSGLLTELAKRDIDFQTHNDSSLSSEKSDALARSAFFADVFLTSANAITMQGEIINVDGHGNRVSAMIFGPKKVIVIAGVNKIVSDEAQAKARIAAIAAPCNALRLHKETPCVHRGICMDCHSEDRICSSYVKLNYDKEKRIHVILVHQNYGY